MKSDLEAALLFQIRAAGLPEPVMEYPFALDIGRRWRWDFAWPSRMLACEVQGGVWRQGRHQRPAGFTRDCEKLSHAAILGWRVLPVTAEHIESGAALAWIQQALERC